jgi:zinc protease
MAKERPVVDGEFQRAESDPGFLLQYEASKKLWGDLFTRKNPIGDHNIINTATPEKMMIIKNKYYYPDNSLLIIAGDVNHDDAFAKAKKIFGDWKSSGIDIHKTYPIPEFKPLTSTEYFIKESSIAQTPSMAFLWHGPDTRNDSAATIAADVFSTILGLNSSKWQQALIDKGLATYVGTSYQTAKYTGTISISALPVVAKMKECYNEIMNQVSMWAQPDYFTDEQLADAKAILRRNQIRANEKPSSLASTVSYNWCSTSLDYFTDYNANMQKVTREDISRYIKKYVQGKPYIAGLILNADANQKSQPASFFKPSL